jgi:hypothetical protein
LQQIVACRITTFGASLRSHRHKSCDWTRKAPTTHPHLLPLHKNETARSSHHQTRDKNKEDMSNPRRSARIAKLAAQREVVPNTAAATPAPRVVKKPGRTPRPKVGVSATRPDQPTAKQQAVQRTPSGNSKRKRRESGEAPEPARKQKTQGNQSEDFAENQSIPDHEKEAEEASRDRAPSSAGSETAFLEILISAISVLRLLDQKRAVRTKCLTEQSQLQILLNLSSGVSEAGTPELLSRATVKITRYR